MKTFRFFILAQTLAIFGGSLVFPFYILFLKNQGGDFTSFGIAFGLFTLAAALFHIPIGKYSDIFGRKPFLILNMWGTAVLLFFFTQVTELWHIYLIQIFMGIFGAMLKTGEKSLLADLTEETTRGKFIGQYHTVLGISSGIGIILGGMIIDATAINTIFYIGIAALVLGGITMFHVQENR